MKLRLSISEISIPFYIIFWLAAFPILAPYYLLSHETIGPIIDYWMYLSIAILFCFVFTRIRRVTNNILIILLIYGLLIAITVMNSGEVIAVLKHSIKVILLCCMIDVIRNEEKMCWTFIHVIRDITFILFVINLITCIVWKNGIPSITQNYLYPYHIFGNVNTTIRVVLPGMLCSTLVNHNKARKFSVCSIVYLTGFIYIYLLIYPTTTTLIAIIIITLWILLENLLINKAPQIYFVGILVVLFLELLIVVLSNTNLIGFIAALFNKSTDFTGRVFLWQRAMTSIQEHPILGVGRQSLTEIRITIGNVSGAHNYFLDILYQRGIVGLTLLVILILRPVLTIRKDAGFSMSVLYLIIGYCICLMAMFLSEPFFEYEYYFIPIFYALYSIAGHTKNNKENNYHAI